MVVSFALKAIPLLSSRFLVEGLLVVRVFEYGILVAEDEYYNIHTDIGDAYIAAKVVTGVGTSAVGAPAFPNGMKLGTGSVAGGNTPAKSGAGAKLTTYLAVSAASFDSGWPKVVDLGAGNGKQAEYQCTYAAGTLTGSVVTEIVLVTDAGADADSAVSQVYARAAVGPYTKDAFTTLQPVWHELFKGV